jgi:hypothetical protein
MRKKGDWRNFLNEKIYDLYSSQNITGMLKPRRIQRPGYVALMGHEKCIQNFNRILELKRLLVGLACRRWNDVKIYFGP